jgi:hypothetical protein
MASNEDDEKLNSDNPSVTQPDETSKLLDEQQKLKSPISFHGAKSTISSVPPPLPPQMASTSKPVLIRQDRAYLASPQLSAAGVGSEESADDFRIDENVRSAPEGLQDWATPKISISEDAYNDENGPLSPLPVTRCRTCRRSSTSPTSIVYFDRSTSKDNIVHGNMRTHLLVHHHSTTIPPVYVTGGSPTRSSKMYRQSSQPDPVGSHSSCSHAHQTSSLRQLREPSLPSSASDALSGIAADALRVRN